MAVVLLNLHAGGGRAAALRAPIADWLRRHHPAVPLHATAGIGQAKQRLAELARGSRVVLVGGDGSLNQLLGTLLDGAHEVALVGAGSGGDGARALALGGRDWSRALSRALLAESVAVDIGWVTTEHESRPFFSSLAAGFDAAVALRALQGPPRLRGLPRYLWATMQELARLQLQTLRVHADGQPVHDGPALFASTLNTPTYGGGMRAVPTARVDDGRLDLLLARRFGRAGALAMLPRLLLGRHLGHRECRHLAFEKLEIDAEAPLPLAADGEPMAAARQIVVRVGCGVLRVVPGAAFRRSEGASGPRS